MEIGIVAQKGNDRARSVAGTVYRSLEKLEISVMVDTATARAIGQTGTDVEKMEGCSFVVSVGGDGTFLFVARHVGGTPILGVNLGEVGFLNAVAPEDAVARVLEEVERIQKTGRPRFREVQRLVASGDGWVLPPALNEIVVLGARRGRNNGLTVEARIDGSEYLHGHADGVLVATQTGSTAYNLSEGGPLVHPGVRGVIVTGMCTEELKPSVVVAPDQAIDIRVSGGDHAVVSSDGRDRAVQTPAQISVVGADEPGRIAGEQSDFFEALNKIG